MNPTDTTCLDCQRSIPAKLLHLGFSDTLALYCSRCEAVLLIDLFNTNLRDLFPPRQIPQGDYGVWEIPYWEKIEALFHACPCGGHFGYLNPPRCPACKGFIVGNLYEGKPAKKAIDGYAYVTGLAYTAEEMLKEEEQDRFVRKQEITAHSLLHMPRTVTDIEQLRDLLPHHKQDCRRAEALVSLGYPAVAPVLPELMTWIQDMNWPVAYMVVAPFLRSIGAPLIPEIRRVLQTDDETWKYWVLNDLVRDSREVAFELEQTLSELANREPKDEAEAALQEIAREILDDLQH